MKFPRQQTLEEIARIIDCDYIGNAEFPVLGMNEIHIVQPGDIVFVDHPKYYDKALNSKATIILLNKKVDIPEGKALLISKDPFNDFNKLTNHFKPFISANSMIAETATIGNNTILQPNVFVGNNVQIGDDCTIHSNVCIYDNTVIGNNVTIHCGTVLGADAFYYKNRPEKYDKLLSGGNVVIEDNVDIGALCTIDKGVSDSTRICEGTKLDNQVHIGHDTILGRRCLVASQVGISGCVIIEDFVTIWGQVGVKSDVIIATGTEIYAQSGIGQSTIENRTYFGSPAMEARDKLREMAYLKKLPDIIDKLDKLK
ncbi:MAG: UDP-3-O-(3-hydroxymyristoyl)glucosamine N-acyltransferase [Bacteroidetes bacterium]|nr:UDP-3-O-(3-hydroxymyristoyl)glucosamine N-acyltransferase [Bacteroidota bacterium]